MKSWQAIITLIVSCLLTFELIVLAELAFFPYFPDMRTATLNIAFYNLMAPFSTVFTLGLLYGWPVRIGATSISRRSTKIYRFIRLISEPFRNVPSTIRTSWSRDSGRELGILPDHRVMLAISLVVGSMLAFIPYRPDINPTGSLVGIDGSLYVGWIDQMLSRPVILALQYSFIGALNGSRPLLLIPLYSIALTGVSPSQVIERLPMVLAPLLSLSTYIFVRYGDGRYGLAGLTAVTTPILLSVFDGLPYNLCLTGGTWDTQARQYQRKVILRVQQMKNVKIVTDINNDLHLDLLSRCSLFLFPAMMEPFGMVTLDAMAFGKPIIALDSGATREVITDAGVFCTESVDNWRGAIRMALSNPLTRQVLSKNGLARAKEFSWEKTAKELIGIIESR
jgi:Glycosyl transferases group 1